MSNSDFPKEIERKPLRKKWFMSLPDGYWILMNPDPFEYIELSKNRERQWKEFGQRNAGRLASTFLSETDCLRARQGSLNLRKVASMLPGRIVDPEKIARAYRDSDDSPPRDPVEALTYRPGVFRKRLTKKLLMNLPTGTILKSNRTQGSSWEPLMTAVIPPLSKRKGFWLEIKNMNLEGRTFRIIVPESRK